MSKVDKMQNYFGQINNGQILDKTAALDMASASQTLIDSINASANAKARSFQSQADVAGVGDQWKKYISGFSPSYNQSTNQPSNQSTIQSDIQNAIKDTQNFPNREALISALVQHYGISQADASKQVYSLWSDNTQR